MTPKEFRTHLIALAKNKGVSPEFREPTEEELKHVEEWLKFRVNTTQENHQRMLDEKYKPSKG